MRLIGFFRSSAAWRVRIALNLKGVAVEHAFRHLRRDEQAEPDYLALNAQGLVPTLVTDDGAALTQSLAIIEWLDETWPDPPLLPGDALARARLRAFALAIACDIHPLQNLKILRRLRGLGHDEAAVNAWAATAIAEGLAACETLVPRDLATPFLSGLAPGLAELCLVPQLASARRFGAPVEGLPRLRAIETACLALDAFSRADPGRQPDAE